MKTVPYTYQLKGARFLHRKKGIGLLADEMGLGKSVQVLMYLADHPEIRPAVFVVPSNLKWNWEHELKKHFGWRAEVLEGCTPHPLGSINKPPEFVIVNYDILHPRERRGGQKTPYPGWGLWLKKNLKPKCVIFDEAHYLSNRKSKRTTAAMRLSRGCPSRICLTATPMNSRPLDLYPVLNILYPKQFDAFLSYAWDFCDPKKDEFGSWIYTGASNLDKLNGLLNNGIMLRRLKSDVLDQLPPKIRTVLPVPLSDPKKYKKALRTFADWYQPDRTGDEIRTHLTKLKQSIGIAKLPAITEWIENFLDGDKGKLLIFGIHHAVLRPLFEKFRKCAVLIDGLVKKNDRKLFVDRFQNNPSCRLFFGNIKAAGIGLNLTAAHTVAFAELAWTPAAHAQAEDRCYARLNDLHGAQVYYFIGHGTLEERLLALLDRKDRIHREAIEGKRKVVKFDLVRSLAKSLIGELK